MSATATAEELLANDAMVTALLQRLPLEIVEEIMAGMTPELRTEAMTTVMRHRKRLATQ